MKHLLLITIVALATFFACEEKPTDPDPVQQEKFTGIFFTRHNLSGQRSVICRINPDGSNLDSISDSLSYKRSPVISPDGTKLVFSAGNLADQDLYLMNVNDTSLTRLTEVVGKLSYPVWSPDGTRILFEAITYPDTLRSVHLVNADGTGHQAITSSALDYHSPIWSETSADSIFLLTPSGVIQMMNLADKGSISFSFGIYSPTGLRFSPVDSSFLLYADVDPTIDSTHWHIFRGDLTGVKPVDISDPDSYDLAPSWSPDGTGFVFRSHGFYPAIYDDGLYIAPASGLAGTKIPGTSTYDHDPCWSPVDQ